MKCYWCKKENVTVEHVEICRRPLSEGEIADRKNQLAQLITSIELGATEIDRATLVATFDYPATTDLLDLLLDLQDAIRTVPGVSLVSLDYHEEPTPDGGGGKK